MPVSVEWLTPQGIIKCCGQQRHYASLDFFRSGELVPSEVVYDPEIHFSRGDITVDSLRYPQTLRIHLKSSKIDPFCVGIDVYVGRTYCRQCLVAAVLAYFTERGPEQGLFFRFCNGKPLYVPPDLWLSQESTGSSGLKYSGHSFRSGAATMAVQRGIGDTIMQLLDRWKSDAYRAYVKTPRNQRN